MQGLDDNQDISTHSIHHYNRFQLLHILYQNSIIDTQDLQSQYTPHSFIPQSHQVSLDNQRRLSRLHLGSIERASRSSHQTPINPPDSGSTPQAIYTSSNLHLKQSTPTIINYS